MIKIGYIGLGCRGFGMLKNVAECFKNVEIEAVCDLFPDRVDKASDYLVEQGRKAPFKTVDYNEVLKMDIDAVMVMTWWETHLEIAIKAMRAGKKVAVEVAGAYSVNDCFELVRTYEETGIHCMMLENCCYGKHELTVLKMAREGKLGEIVHASGGYHHYLVEEITKKGLERHHYRLRNYLSRNCDNYPTHELGPIAKILNINRGNRMMSLVSMASKTEGFYEYINQNPDGLEQLKGKKFAQGDVVTTAIKCANGETIVLTLDTALPRSYSRGFTVRGTKGSFFEDTDSFYIHEDAEKDPGLEYNWKPQWGNFDKYYEENKPDIWKKYGEPASSSGHGGMDYMVLSAFFESVEKDAVPPIDTYDTASWMVISCLSEQSIANGSAPVSIPDFTRGQWAMEREKSNLVFSLDK